MRVTICQFPSTSDKDANRRTITEYVERAANQGAQLVLLPEMAMFFSTVLDERFSTNAEPVPGSFTQFLGTLAQRTGVGIVAGMTELTATAERPHNTAYAVGPDGAELARYRKVHLYDAFGLRESDVIAASPDSAPAYFDFGGVRFGICSCYDLRFPETMRALMDYRVTVVLLVAAWAPGPHKTEQFRTLVRARAIENTCYVLAANQSPPDCTGDSLGVDPQGVVIGSVDADSGIAEIDVDMTALQAIREMNPSLANRRYRVELTAAPLGPV